MDYDKVIKNGTVVTASERFQADLGVRGERIAALGQHLRGGEEINAKGLYVLPGGVDPHVHLQMPTGVTVSSDDWDTGTLAAAHGGTTTVIDFVEPEEGETLVEAFEKRRAEAEGRASIDYGLHMTITAGEPESLAQIPEAVAVGLTSFKIYTTYEGFKLDAASLLNVLAAVGEAGGLVIVHAENDALIHWQTQRLFASGERGPQVHGRSRPGSAEGEAIERVLTFAETAEARVYVVHVSTGRGAAAIARARARGQRAYGETCPQYLLLTEEEYQRPEFEGAKFVCSPPLRKRQDNQALWGALARRELQTVGTDHCSFFYEGQKDLGKDSFTDIPGGLPGIEARLALVYTFGVGKGRLSLNRWVEVCATAPARLFDLYPRKGALVPGADADIVLFDPQKKLTLSQSLLHENVDYTPYEGFELTGYPVMTMARGRVLVREGEFVGTKGQGSYLKRPLGESSGGSG